MTIQNEFMQVKKRTIKLKQVKSQNRMKKRSKEKKSNNKIEKKSGKNNYV